MKTRKYWSDRRNSLIRSPTERGSPSTIVNDWNPSVDLELKASFWSSLRPILPASFCSSNLSLKLPAPCPHRLQPPTSSFSLFPLRSPLPPPLHSLKSRCRREIPTSQLKSSRLVANYADFERPGTYPRMKSLDEWRTNSSRSLIFQLEREPEGKKRKGQLNR